MANGKLYLIPTVIAENRTDQIPEEVRAAIKNIQHFLVENQRTTRRYISSLQLGITIEDLRLDVLDKKTSTQALKELMKPIHQGQDIGVISESGCPGIADPGSAAVKYAHTHGISVIPLVGPSSIFMALMASGLNGQSFSFHGYLPIDKKQLEDTLRRIELDSRKKNQTQIFIETPYRNQQLFQNLIKWAQPDTLLCVAKNISGKDETIKTASIKEWRSSHPDLHKRPTVFLLYAGS